MCNRVAYILLSFLIFLTYAIPAQETKNPLLSKGNPLVSKKEESIKFEIIWSKDSFNKGDDLIAALKISLAEGFHINPPVHKIPKNYAVEVVPTKITIKDLTNGAVAQTPEYSTPSKEFLEAFEAEMLFYKNSTYVFIPIKIRQDFQGEQLDISIDIYYQMCDESKCFRPKTETISGQISQNQTSKAKLTHEEIFAQYHTLQVKTDYNSQTSEDDNLTSILLVQVFLALVGGILLNFTPCVLPVIPLKMMSLSKNAGSLQKSMLLGLVMSIGVITFWVVMGIIISTVPSFNTVSKLFQNNFFNIAVGVIVAIMAVGMCGLFNFQVPQSIASFNPKFSSIAGSFGIGIMTAILATPCTGPFLGGALAWALKQPQHVTLLVFFAIGFGMALPYFILSSVPSLINWVPKAGPVSNVIKETMGILMLAAAAYFIGLGLTSILDSFKGKEFYWYPPMLLVTFAGVWVIIQTIKLKPALPKKLVFISIGLGIIISSLFLLKFLTATSPLTWQKYTPELLAKLKAENKTILIDFTADYCLNCKALEKLVINDPSIVKIIKDNNIDLIKVDITDEKDVQNNNLLIEEGSRTIPYVVIYKNGKRIFNADIFKKEDLAKILKQ